MRKAFLSCCGCKDRDVTPFSAVIVGGALYSGPYCRPKSFLAWLSLCEQSVVWFGLDGPACEADYLEGCNSLLVVLPKQC